MELTKLPAKYEKQFKKIVEEEFSGNSGLCLRELVRTWQGIYVDPNEELNVKIELLVNELTEFKEFVLRTFREKSETKEDGIKMLDGTKIKHGGKEDESISRPTRQTAKV